MEQKQCPRCGKPIEQGDARFCPYCGAEMAATEPAPVPPEAQQLLDRAQLETDPKKKYDLLKRAQAQFPDCLPVAEELLFLGRLNERDPRKLDFSVIKSYLWQLYLTPEDFTAEQQNGMRREFFDHADLARCLRLAPDADAFMRRYLERLAREFVRIFLMGSNRYMHSFFGLRMESHAAKNLAGPVRFMLAGIAADEALTPEQKNAMTQALETAYAGETGGDLALLRAPQKR